MKELDVVKLTKDFNGLSIGTEGTIVLEYDGTHFKWSFSTQMVLPLMYSQPQTIY